MNPWPQRVSRLSSLGALGLYSQGSGSKNGSTRGRNESLVFSLPGSPWTLLPGIGEQEFNPWPQRVSRFLSPREPLDFTPGDRGTGIQPVAATSPSFSLSPGALVLWTLLPGSKNQIPWRRRRVVQPSLFSRLATGALPGLRMDLPTVSKHSVFENPLQQRVTKTKRERSRSPENAVSLHGRL